MTRIEGKADGLCQEMEAEGHEHVDGHHDDGAPADPQLIVRGRIRTYRAGADMRPTAPGPGCTNGVTEGSMATIEDIALHSSPEVAPLFSAPGASVNEVAP